MKYSEINLLQETESLTNYLPNAVSQLNIILVQAFNLSYGHLIPHFCRNPEVHNGSHKPKPTFSFWYYTTLNQIFNFNCYIIYD